MIRFVHFFNYAAGVSVEAGEAWYKGEHVPQVQKLPGVLGYRTWKVLEHPVRLLTPYPTPLDQYVRMCELGFDDLRAARMAVLLHPALWTPSAEGKPGFREFEGMFLHLEPQYDLLRDVPAQQYKYITLPLMWPNGVPEYEENEDMFTYVYCFNYAPGVSIVDGEDWYLGHHNREGKQLPGIKRYKTWKTVRIPDEGAWPFRPNKFYRLTKIGWPSMEQSARTMRNEQRIRFTPSPVGRVLGEWRNWWIKPELFEDLI